MTMTMFTCHKEMTSPTRYTTTRTWRNPHWMLGRPPLLPIPWLILAMDYHYHILSLFVNLILLLCTVILSVMCPLSQDLT